MGLVPRHAEHGREIGAMKVVPEAKLEDLTLTGVQPVEGGGAEPSQFSPLRVAVGAGVGRRADRASQVGSIWPVCRLI